MNPYTPPRSAVSESTPKAYTREAPAAMVTACKTQSAWQGMLVILFAGLGVVGWRISALATDHLRLTSEFTGRDLTPMQRTVPIIGWVVVSFALGNALAAYNSRRALLVFSRYRHEVLLHVAMKRVRLQWRVFAITFVITISAFQLPALLEFLAQAGWF